MAAGLTAGLQAQRRDRHDLGTMQRQELFLTAAQSAFAVVVLANRRFSVKEGAMLLGLFLAQFVIGAVVPESAHGIERIVVGVIYLVLAAGMLIAQRRSVRRVMVDGLRTPVDDLVHAGADE